jgi:hypothetical protein
MKTSTSFLNGAKEKSLSQAQPKQLSEQAVKKVANVLHIMLNDKKR